MLEEVMDSVQMVTSAGRTAGALLTLFNTTANRQTAETATELLSILAV